MGLGAALWLALTGCSAHVDGPSAGVDVAAAPAGVTFTAQDDYDYYPNYGVYYSSHLHQYAYQQDGAWVSRTQPQGVSVNVLRASPSVRMDFHDSPASHHEAVVRQYPKDWKPSVGNNGRKDDDHEGK
jgi:hypothetical protein